MKTVTVFRPFSLLTIPKTEDWLKRQAQKGYRLVSYRWGRFTFAEAKPKEREYLIYRSPHTMRNDAFGMEFFSIAHSFGARKWDLRRTGYGITELRTGKMDI